MKIKHVGFIEQHVEKFILVGAVILGVFIFWLFATGEPYAVDIDRRKGVKPGEVEKVVLDRAVALDRAIKLSESPLPTVTIYDFTELFRKRLDQPMVVANDGEPQNRLPVPFAHRGIGSETIAARTERLEVPYYLASPPGPELSDIETGYAVLGEIDDETVRSEFLKLVGDREPPDFRFVEITGTYDWEAWRERLQDESLVEEGTRILPEDTWRNLMLLSDVIVERQKWVYESGSRDGAGSWSEPVALPPVPGTMSFRGVSQTFLEDEARKLIQDIRQEQTTIAKASLPVKGADAGPSAQAQPAVDLDPERIDRLDQLNDRIVELQEQIQETALRRGENSSAIRRPQAMLVRLERERDNLLGISTTRRRPDPGLRPGFEPAGVPREAVSGETPLAPSVFELRAYDLSAEPGQVYRYRLRIGVINPLFRRNNTVPAQRAENFNKVAITSDPSEWSDRVSADQEKEFFFVNASQPDVATFEIWTVFNGKRRSQLFDVRPGDLIGNKHRIADNLTSADVDLLIDTVVVDTTIPTTPGRNRTRVTLLDLQTGALFVRDLSSDRDSERRLTLRTEAAEPAVEESDDENDKENFEENFEENFGEPTELEEDRSLSIGR